MLMDTLIVLNFQHRNWLREVESNCIRTEVGFGVGVNNIYGNLPCPITKALVHRNYGF